jgi:Spy/CpxP family protein refolding chaperone
MRTVSKWVLVATVALCVAGSAMAQGGGGGGGRGGQGRGGQGGQGRGGFGGGMMGGATVAALLNLDGVQKELKVTDEQKTKIKEFSDAQRAKMQEAFSGGAPDQEKMAEMRKAATEAGDKFVKDTLNADQQKRIKQLLYQAMGIRAFSNDDVVKTLSLTDDQKGKVKTLSDEMRKDQQELMQDLRGGGDAATEARKKMTTLGKEYLAKAADVLTPDQRKQWKEMTGDPVDPSILQAAPGGRGNRGGAGGGAGGGRGNRGGNNPPPPPAI